MIYTQFLLFIRWVKRALASLVLISWVLNLVVSLVPMGPNNTKRMSPP